MVKSECIRRLGHEYEDSSIPKYHAAQPQIAPYILDASSKSNDALEASHVDHEAGEVLSGNL